MKLSSVLSTKQKKGLAAFVIALSTALALLVIDDELNAIRGGFGSFTEQVTAVRRLSLELGEGDADPTPVSVFYNAYFPPQAATDEPAKERIVGILREQIKQVSSPNSGLADRANVVVRVVTIGPQLDYEAIVADACTEADLVCSHEKHYDEGFEMVTQDLLLQYCQDPQNESHIVGYIHNKGSFHPSEGQDRHRRGLTQAALSEPCMEMLDTKNSCNVCGASFKSAFGPMWWGDFWSARCDYIKNLVPSSLLQEKNKLAFELRPKLMTMDLFNDDSFTFALPRDPRFAAEIFVGTHPKLVPCSLTHDQTTWWSGDPPTPFRQTIISHHVPFGENDKTYDQYMDEIESDGHALTDYHLLPGILWKYQFHYHQMPPADSWVWRHFPDGEKWQLAVAQMGYPEAFYHRYENEFLNMVDHSGLRGIVNETQIEMS